MNDNEGLKDKIMYGIVFIFYFCLLILFSPDLSFYLTSPDQGYQVALGKLILLGNIPFKDILFGYGPLVGYTSAFGQYISNSLIGETVICSFGYALSLLIIFFLVSRYSSKSLGFISTIIGFLLLARFYKWYYWLFASLILLCIYLILNSKKPYLNSKWLYISGFVCGIGGLFRLDLGIGLIFLFSIFIIFLLKLDEKNELSEVFLRLISFWLFFLIPYIIWAFFLYLSGGSFFQYLTIFHDMTLGIVQYFSLPLPIFDLRNPFSPQSCIGLAFLLVPLSLIFICIHSFLHIYKNSDKDHSKYIFLMFSSLLGLIIFPQAIQRAGLAHLLQIMPPVIISVSIALSNFYQMLCNYKKYQVKFSGMCLFCIYLISIALIGVVIFQSGGLRGSDLVYDNPLQKLVQINEGMHSVDNNQIIDLVNIVQNNTKPSDRILIIARQDQLYYFINRPLSGMATSYAPGIWNLPYWRSTNLDKISFNPPKVVMVKYNFTCDVTGLELNQYYPELYNYIISNYNQTLYQSGDWIILKRNGE
jgi:hypothetical protein